MSALTVAAVLGLAAACQSAVAPETVLKIATVESHLEPFAIHDNKANESFAPATKPEAYRLATALIVAGHRSLDIGLTQINTVNFSWLDLSLAAALDPCTNIAASAQVLTAYSRYNTGSPSAGIKNGYAAKVTAVRIGTEAPSPPPKQQVDDPGDPQPPAWDMEAVAAWRHRHDPTPEDALAPADPPPAPQEKRQ